MSACRSCQRPIKWAVVKKTGKRMPIDAEPVETGNIEIVGERPTEYGPSPLIVVHAKGELPMLPGKERYMPHFATCPHAADHRRR